MDRVTISSLCQLYLPNLSMVVFFTPWIIYLPPGTAPPLLSPHLWSTSVAEMDCAHFAVDSCPQRGEKSRNPCTCRTLYALQSSTHLNSFKNRELSPGFLRSQCSIFSNVSTYYASSRPRRLVVFCVHWQDVLQEITIIYIHQSASATLFTSHHTSETLWDSFRGALLGIARPRSCTFHLSFCKEKYSDPRNNDGRVESRLSYR